MLSPLINPETVIEYQLLNACNVEINIFNVHSQKVALLMRGYRPAGCYKISWNGRDEIGRPAARGVYLYQVKAGDFCGFENAEVDVK